MDIPLRSFHKKTLGVYPTLSIETARKYQNRTVIASDKSSCSTSIKEEKEISIVQSITLTDAKAFGKWHVV